MQVEQSFVLQAPLEPVWHAFHDVALLVGCLPGASIDESARSAASNDAGDAQADVPLLFKVKLGPIAAQFKGRGQLEHDEAAHAGSFTGSAVDGKTSSRIKGAARFALSPDAGPSEQAATRVAVTVEFTITGALAQFSREGIVRALADQLSRQFADSLQQRLPQAGSPATQAAPHETADSSASTAASASVQPPAVGYAAPLPDIASAESPSPSALRQPPARPAAATESSLDLWQLFKGWLSGLLRSKDSPK